MIAMSVSFETSIGIDDAVIIQFPTNLGSYDQVTAIIIQSDNNLQLSSTVVANSKSRDNYYIFQFGAQLPADTLFKIEVSFSRIITGG